jgi:hypothetical protein
MNAMCLFTIKDGDRRMYPEIPFSLFENTISSVDRQPLCMSGQRGCQVSRADGNLAIKNGPPKVGGPRFFVTAVW